MTGQAYPQGWAHVTKPFDFYDLKGALEVLAAKISLDNIEIICYDVESGEVLKGELRSNGKEIGRWGLWSAEVMSKRDIDAPVGWFELDLGVVIELRRSDTTFTPLPRFPNAWRDLALVTDESIPSAELLATIHRAGGSYLVKAEPFDIFRGEKVGTGKKSIAIRLEFSHPERSLESEEVDGWMQNILQGLSSAHGVNLR